MVKGPHRYDNLIDNQRPIPRKPMDAIKRAAQFAPFAALTGYDDQISETARITDKEIYLDEDEKRIIDYRLQYIHEHVNEQPVIEVTYYVSDKELHRDSVKSGGKYLTHTGNVKKIDSYEGCIIFTDKTRIPINAIIELTHEGLDR